MCFFSFSLILIFHNFQTFTSIIHKPYRVYTVHGKMKNICTIFIANCIMIVAKIFNVQLEFMCFASELCALKLDENFMFHISSNKGQTFLISLILLLMLPLP